MKQKFDIITSTCVPLPLENVDTDQIIPARFLKATTREESFFGENLFRDWRYHADGTLNKDFVLNDPTYGGEILVAGQPNDSLEAKHALGYVPEMPAVYELLTVGEHVEFIRRAYRLGEEANAYADALLERFEMADKRDKLGKELSKGMQQKLSVICALLPRPEVVIFDEPLVGLDPHAIKELKELCGELKRGGASVLISTHMIDSVEDFWDVAHIMMNGRFAATRENREGVDEKPLEQLFFEITERDKGERA